MSGAIDKCANQCSRSDDEEGEGLKVEYAEENAQIHRGKCTDTEENAQIHRSARGAGSKH